MAGKKPTREHLSKAGEKLRNPRTPEIEESKAARTLRQARRGK
jgi:hypothetical protein